MCTVIVVNNMEHLEDYVSYSRKYVARGMFYKTDEGIQAIKEKFEEQRIPTSLSADWAVIHCRQPTQGSPDKDHNNHPWIIDGRHRYVVGCQVGAVSYNNKDIIGLPLQGRCDSEVALSMIANSADPWPWIDKHCFGMLFFWAGRSATEGSLYSYNPQLSRCEDGALITRGLGYHRERGLTRLTFSGERLDINAVSDTVRK